MRLIRFARLSATGPFRVSTDEEFTNFPWMVLKLLSHFQAEVSRTFSECMDNATTLHACFRTHKCVLNEFHADANSNGRCLAAKLFISRACRVKWFWFGVVACSGRGARGSCAHYNVHTWPSAPLSTLTGIPKSAANGVPSEAFSSLSRLCSQLLLAASSITQKPCPLQNVNRKWKMNEGGWNCLQPTLTHESDSAAASEGVGIAS